MILGSQRNADDTAPALLGHALQLPVTVFKIGICAVSHDQLTEFWMFECDIIIKHGPQNDPMRIAS